VHRADIMSLLSRNFGSLNLLEPSGTLQVYIGIAFRCVLPSSSGWMQNSHSFEIRGQTIKFVNSSR